MNQVISLKEAERKIYAIATHDGLLDVFLGCFCLMFVIALFLSTRWGDFWSSAVFIPFLGIVMLVIYLIRKHIIKPRIGSVAFGPARKKKIKKYSYVMLILNLAAFIAGIIIFLNFKAFSGYFISITFGLICLILFSTAAYFLEYSRLYAYGLLVGFSPIIGEWLWVRGGVSHHGFPITFGVTSGIMIVTGLIVLIRFLINNPLPKEEITSGDC